MKHELTEKEREQYIENAIRFKNLLLTVKTIKDEKYKEYKEWEEDESQIQKEIDKIYYVLANGIEI